MLTTGLRDMQAAVGMGRRARFTEPFLSRQLSRFLGSGRITGYRDIT